MSASTNRDIFNRMIIVKIFYDILSLRFYTFGTGASMIHVFHGFSKTDSDVRIGNVGRSTVEKYICRKSNGLSLTNKTLGYT